MRSSYLVVTREGLISREQRCGLSASMLAGSKNMSTNTTFMQILLVAIVGLVTSLMSVAPANAAVLDIVHQVMNTLL